jgi:hypothetical protein
MSKRTERREAERAARKLAYQQSRQQPPAQVAQAAQVAAAEQSETTETDLLARAQAFFERPAATPTTSQAQIAAKQANAQLSTGPITTEGKAISSRNNTRHGLAGDTEADDFKVLPTEDQNAYNQNLADFRKEWKPATATEHDLVNRLVMHQWLRRRALRLQNAQFSPETGEIADIKKFELYRRYETAHERGYNKAFADLLRLRSFQMRERNGFESQKRKNEEHEFKMQRLKRQEELKEAVQTAKTERENRTPLTKAA